jgi:hypothetical protein
VTLSSGETDVRLGRQRVAWGTGRFWSPVDLINPLDPIALEREERPGVDAALLERKLGALSRISAVYAPATESSRSSAGVNWHANARGVDYSLIAGRFRSERVAGGDVATQLGAAGVRAELTHHDPEPGTSYRRAVAAMDYAFANTLTLSGELYYNGAGAAERVPNAGRRYFGGYAGYEITPLLKSANYLVVNLADRSRFFSPSLIFSLRANLDLSAGVHLFGGSPGSEYERLSDLYYAQLQWFF